MNSACFLRLLLLLGLASAPLLAADETPVPIPDPVLASAVRGALGLQPDAVVTQAAILKLNYVNVDSRTTIDDDGNGGIIIRSVADLTGLEHAHNLQNIYLGGGPYHNITSLEPIRGLTRLDTLRLPHAVKATGDALLEVTEVIGELHSLVSLSLEGDGLENRHLTPLASLTALEYLDLDENQLTDLTPLRELRRLRELDLDNNPLGDFSPLASLQRLRDLDLSDWISYFSLIGEPIHPAASIRSLHSLPPLRGLRQLQTAADDLGPLARLDHLQYLESHGRVADFTPLANLEHLAYLQTARHSIEDVTPLGMIPAFQPQQYPGDAWWPGVDFTRPANAAVLEGWYQRGLLSAGIPLPPPRIWKPAHFIPDGRVRDYVSAVVNRLENLLQPADLNVPGFTTLNLDGLRSLAGLQHAGFLRTITSHDGWIVDLSPLGGLSLTTAVIDLRGNYINDVTPLAGKPFASLDLRNNPINPETVPASWWTDARVKLDPRRVLEPQQAIPDSALRAAIRIALGLPPDAPVLPADLQQLVYLYAEGSRIESIAGLQLATNLKGVALRNNVLTDLTPLANLNALQWVRASGNPLNPGQPAFFTFLRNRGVRVDDDPAGRFLSAITPVNRVVYADGYQLPSIRYLQLFPDVQVLFLSGNYLKDISLLNNLPQLQRVHLDGNLLETAAGTPTRAILDALVARGVTVTFEPQRPEMSSGTLIPDENLQRAIADGAGLPFVPPRFTQAQLLSVTEFDWEQSFPSAQPRLLNPETLLLMPNLTRLSLEGAGLEDISFIASLTHLTHLDLDYNRISDLSALAGLTSLVELDANNNQVANLTPLAQLIALQKLDLDHNAITDLSALSALVNLIELDLQANQLNNLDPLLSLTSLQQLNIAFNELPMNAAQAAVVASIRAQNPFLWVVTAPQRTPQLELVSGGGGMTLQWVAEAGAYYSVWRSEDLVTWQFVKYEYGVNNGDILQVPLGVPGQPKGFYRVIVGA